MLQVTFGNKYKLQRAKSGEYGGCSITEMRLSAKNSLTAIVVWAGALSWCRIHVLFLTNLVSSSSLVLWVYIGPRYNIFDLLFGLQVPIWLLSYSLYRKKMISITFNLDLIIRAFVILGEVRVFQCIDCRFISESYWSMFYHT